MIMNKLLFKTTDVRGFTLIETLVSVFIITVAIIGPLTVASNASIYAKLTKDTMTAAYLAQEAVELIRHQQDSVYIRCADKNAATCAANANENPGEAAWRIFKERMGNNAQGVSCFTDSNSSGCSYDFIDMTENPSGNPSKYTSTSSSCNTLSYDTSSRLYLCTGVRGSGLRQTGYSRAVKIVSVPTFSGVDQAYNDDLRVTVTVTFRKSNGYTHQIKIVDFLHARA